MTLNSGVAQADRPLVGRQARTWGDIVRKTLRKPQFWFGVTVFVPTLIWYWIFAYQPIINAFYISTLHYNLLNPAASKFAGLENFRMLFDNYLFPISVINTLTWTILSFAGMLPVALGVSLCLVYVKRGRNLYQAIIFLPVVISLVAVSLMFRMLMDPEQGQFNYILEGLGLPGSDWLSSPDTALITMVGIGIWKGLGFYVVILTAGILNIPEDLEDAATVDGVNPWQRIRYMTLPLISHTLALVTVVLAIGALQEFTGVFVMTNGGPGNATYMYNLLIYQEAFQFMRFGTATAAALMQFAMIITITIVQLRLIRPQWNY